MQLPITSYTYPLPPSQYVSMSSLPHSEREPQHLGLSFPLSFVTPPPWQVAKKHGAGTKFVVCVSSGSSGDNATPDTKMITGIISNTPNASPSASNSTGHVEPVMDGDAPSLQDWSNIRGNLDDGCRLWAWVY